MRKREGMCSWCLKAWAPVPALSQGPGNHSKRLHSSEVSLLACTTGSRLHLTHGERGALHPVLLQLCHHQRGRPLCWSGAHPESQELECVWGHGGWRDLGSTNRRERRAKIQVQAAREAVQTPARSLQPASPLPPGSQRPV